MKNSHIDYLSLINVLEKHTKYVEFLQLIGDEEIHELVLKYKEYIITKKTVTNWLNTGGKGILYKLDIPLNIKSSFFDDLRQYNDFFYIKINSKLGEFIEYSDFGINNMAIFNMNGELIFYTIPHEGYIWKNDNVFKCNSNDN